MLTVVALNQLQVFKTIIGWKFLKSYVDKNPSLGKTSKLAIAIRVSLTMTISHVVLGLGDKLINSDLGYTAI